MQPTAVDFNAQQFFQTNITEVYFTSEVVQEGELAGFVGRLEHENFMTESIDEAVGICGIEVSVLVEEPDSAGALTSFDYQLQSSGVPDRSAHRWSRRRMRLCASFPIRTEPRGRVRWPFVLFLADADLDL